MSNTPDDKINKILDHYDIAGVPEDVHAFGNGHINDTLCVTYDNGGKKERYVLQKINKFIFPDAASLMENTVNVTGHIRNKVIAEGGDIKREVLTVIPCKDGTLFHEDEDGDCWRVTYFIEGASSHDMAAGPEDFYITGRAFGHFQSQLSDYPAQTLHEVIPGFHNTRKRYEGFVNTVDANAAGRADTCRDEIRFILERKELAGYAMDSLDRGELPLRVTHNDTKINNLMIDDKTGVPICVIDLDTVMPGLAMFDFGDGIRTGASTAAEDEPELDKVSCDMELYEAFARGFVEGCDGKLTEHEIDTLPMGALGITYEQALRFLADYLEGDVYYKTAYPDHNLIRARTQIRLVQDMENKWEQIQAIISRCKEERQS